MRKKITAKVDEYMIDFKNSIKDYFQENNLKVTNNEKEDEISDFLKFIYDYKSIEFNQDDFQKRKRIKNKVPDFNRCCALKSNGERCSRKVKEEGQCNYCGTHIKGIPYGSILNSSAAQENHSEKKVEIWIQEVNGIEWYIDNELNVYDVNDIKNGSLNPKIVHKLRMNSKMQYEFCD